ncbi:hypothetical protein PHLCEN_2v9449 [Hermanssonia centrifuga]|uniref:Phospholipid/glycerol acyltransferase domain-containing protein n=1 Tax=Hermanssonia centrifuga TaxID=98765 RepID=A0A2R6NQR0_9APHY|nr:hypothetical protein PHLCEN_2v9449 [Hermanssonia centrifuga]
MQDFAAKLAENPVSSNLVYDTALFLWKIVIYVFFREIRPRGAFNIPRKGPVIFVAAPHHNQALPIVRAADDAKPGSGQITISGEDPCLVLGHDTKFLSEFTPKMQIMLPKSVGSLVAEVVEVKSDVELRIKKEFGGDSGKGTAFVREKIEGLQAEGLQGVGFKILPYVDQQDTYHHVYECLKEGGCIVIFPEGGSHDRTDLLPLKAGVSLMALGAMANNPDVKVQIVPVGLSYFHPDKFRSRAVVEFGPAMQVPDELVEMFKQGGPQKRDAIGKLLNLIYDGLKTVTIRAPDYETLMLTQAARRLYMTPGQHLTLGQVVELNKRFLESYLKFKDEPKIQKLRSDVLKYNRILRDLGLRDHQVPVARKAGWKTFGLFLYRIFLLFVWGILALPGVILNGPIFLTARIMSRKKAKEALAASTVKVAARDVIGTWKVLISLGLTPVLYGFYAFLAALVMIKANAPLMWRVWTPFFVITALPVIAYAALKFGEAGMDVLKSLRPLVISLFPGQQRYLDQLKDMRVRLAKELDEVISEYGPKAYDDFEETRILIPAASVPPSVRGGLTRPKSQADAQGKLLVHPMTWLDERLFGWSHTASHGGSSNIEPDSRGTSRAPSPDFSGDEIGDYDNLLGYLDGKNLSRSRSRSIHNSYADLQKLRQTGGSKDGLTHPVMSTGVPQLVPNPSLDPDGLHIRTSRPAVRS